MAHKTNQGAIALTPLLKDRGKRAELADSIGADRGTLTRWLSGALKPGAGYRMALQERLGIDWRLWDQETEAPDDNPENDVEPNDDEPAASSVTP